MINRPPPPPRQGPGEDGSLKAGVRSVGRAQHVTMCIHTQPTGRWNFIRPFISVPMLFPVSLLYIYIYMLHLGAMIRALGASPGRCGCSKTLFDQPRKTFFFFFFFAHPCIPTYISTYIGMYVCRRSTHNSHYS